MMLNQSLKTTSVSTALPLMRGLVLPFALSLLVAAILALASAGGLLYQDLFYPAAELRQSFVPNDIVNLCLGLPILLLSLGLARRGRLLGLLFWPGALFYIFYNALAYTFALPLNVAFLLNLLLATLSIYTMVLLLCTIDARPVEQRLAGVVPRRMAAGILILLGVAYFLLSVGVFAAALINRTSLDAAESATHAVDLLISPAWIAGGLLLWRRRSLGYVSAIGLLFQANMLFVGLIAFLFLQPLLSAGPFLFGDLLAVAVMWLLCLIPFALLIRGMSANEDAS
jgi:hypothetical protein